MRKISFFLLFCLFYISLSANENACSDKTILGYNTFLEQIKNLKISEAENSFNDEMKKALSEEQLKTVALSYFTGVILPVKSEQIKCKSQNEMVAAVGEVDLDKKRTANVILSFDKDGKIAGFFINNIQLNAESEKETPYVDEKLFIEKEFVVKSDKGDLPGILTYPAKYEGKIPAVVIVHGSGPVDMDGTVGGTKIYKDMAHFLASKGIAVLRYEKRTRAFPNQFKESFTIDSETVNDAVNAVELIKKAEGIDEKNVFVAGHSLGAYIAPRIALKSGVKGIAMISAPYTNLGDITLAQLQYIEENETLTKRDMQVFRQMKRDAEKVSYFFKKGILKANGFVFGAPKAYWEDLYKNSPLETLKKLDKPVLILNGGRDYQVPDREFELYKNNFSDKKNITFILVKDINHALVAGKEKPGRAEYAKKAHVDKETLTKLTNWIFSNSAKSLKK